MNPARVRLSIVASECNEQGVAAFFAGLTLNDCPWPILSFCGQHWCRGLFAAATINGAFSHDRSAS